VSWKQENNLHWPAVLRRRGSDLPCLQHQKSLARFHDDSIFSFFLREIALDSRKITEVKNSITDFSSDVAFTVSRLFILMSRTRISSLDGLPIAAIAVMAFDFSIFSAASRAVRYSAVPA
jgi:hypothetical protein